MPRAEHAFIFHLNSNRLDPLQIMFTTCRRSLVRLLPFATALLFCASPTGADPLGEAEPHSRRYDTFVDRFHSGVSDRLLSTAEWLDSFFDDERYESEVNRTRLRLSFETSLVDAEGFEFDADTRLRILLPELEDRLSFEVSGDTREDFRNRPVGGTGMDEVDDEDDGALTAGFRYLVRGTDRLNLGLSSGVRIRDLRPVLFVEPRHRLTFDYDPWILRFTQRVRWFTDEGWDIRSQTDAERLVFGEYFFRATGRVKWFERENGMFYDLDFGISRPLDDKSAAELQWNNRFETRPQHELETTFFQLRYRRRFWREWLSFETGPQLAFPADRDYRPTLGVFFKLNMVFGYTKP